MLPAKTLVHTYDRSGLPAGSRGESAAGQSCRSDRARFNSGLPRLTDILRASRYVSKVPTADVARREPPLRVRRGSVISPIEVARGGIACTCTVADIVARDDRGRFMATSRHWPSPSPQILMTPHRRSRRWFRLKIPLPVFTGIMLVAGPVLAQQRLPTIAPEQYTASNIPPSTSLAMQLNTARYQFSGEGPRLSRFPN
jgi:hypothetical protein